MGSIVNIDGTNYTVVDRGGSGLSSVGRVDIFTPEGHRACYKYGTGKCTLTIMRLAGKYKIYKLGSLKRKSDKHFSFFILIICI